jgi:hypothetical protein
VDCVLYYVVLSGDYVRSPFHCNSEIINLEREKAYFWLSVLEVLVAPLLLWFCDEIAHHDGSGGEAQPLSSWPGSNRELVENTPPNDLKTSH